MTAKKSALMGFAFVLILFLSSELDSIPSVSTSEDLNLLSGNYPPEKLRDILIPAKDWHPYPRAAETAGLIAAAISRAPKPEPLQALVPDASPIEALRALRSLHPVEQLVCVGHEPLLSSLAALLLTGSVDGMRIDLKKGGAIAVVLRNPAPRTAVLAWVATPRALRRVGRGRAAAG